MGGRDIVLRFKRNAAGFWREYRLWIIVFAAAVLFDAASTMYFMLKAESSRDELHPAIRLASWLGGPILGPLFGAAGKIAAALAVAIYWQRIARYIFAVGSVLAFWAAWYNIWGVSIYVPRLLTWFV
jgi:hypothetical protein